MSYDVERRYRVWLWLAPHDAPRLWNWAVWSRIEPSLRPLVRSDRGETIVEAHHFANKKRRTQSLRWKAAAHERWTHRSPKSASTEPTFDGMRAFAPSLDLCDERPFDAMLALDDLPGGGRPASTR